MPANVSSKVNEITELLWIRTMLGKSTGSMLVYGWRSFLREYESRLYWERSLDGESPWDLGYAAAKIFIESD